VIDQKRVGEDEITRELWLSYTYTISNRPFVSVFAFSRSI